ncbi:acyl-CoA N-acyltransferase [Mycena maculata]|uniref:Acyl-CoA N-acyltransferase n=1 Tax=Mycena maculata TaxID=230809 RepID=A0AAD7IDY8_9AGAR|nr:acyl-CoA N-acyltransferase [Mycena maculata]
MGGELVAAHPTLGQLIMSADSGALTFKLVAPEDLEQAITIENVGFPADEAATLEAFQLRQSLAQDLFLGAYQKTGSEDRLVGYVCSTLSSDASLTHESMSTHVPGVGLKLLREYIARLETVHREKSAPYERVLLITHENLRRFYEKAGFEWLGPSHVEHGSRPWYEMRIILGFSAQQPPPGVLEALQRPSNSGPAPRLLSSFPGGIPELASSQSNILVNKFDLLCPGCGSVILKSSVAKLTDAPSVQIEPADSPHHPLLPDLPPSPTMIQWWLITPSPMEFENIAFSHAVESLGDKMKLLACAECDLGPLGWCKEGGKEFWLACSRVGYQTLLIDRG